MLIDQRDPDPIELAVGTLASALVCPGVLVPRHQAAILEVQNHRHRFPFLTLEEASRLAHRAGTDAVELLRRHFEALATGTARPNQHRKGPGRLVCQVRRRPPDEEVAAAGREGSTDGERRKC